jgi:hypothetical protein
MSLTNSRLSNGSSLRNKYFLTKLFNNADITGVLGNYERERRVG